MAFDRGEYQSFRGVPATLLLLIATALTAGCSDDIPRTTDTPKSSARRAEPIDSQTVVLKQAEPVRKYNVRSGRIEYHNSHLDRRQTYYFSGFGAREAVYNVVGTADLESVPFDVSVYANGWRYDYNTAQRRGIAKFQPNAEGALLGVVPDLRTVQLTSHEPRTIAGVNTVGVGYSDRGDVRLWMWKGIPLRVERRTAGGDTMVLEAISVNITDKVDIARFTIPDEIAIARVK